MFEPIKIQNGSTNIYVFLRPDGWVWVERKTADRNYLLNELPISPSALPALIAALKRAEETPNAH